MAESKKKLADLAAEQAAAKPAAAITRGGMFGVFKDVDEAENGGDLVNLKFEKGDTKFRIISMEMLIVRKHWDAPQSAEGKMAPCLKMVPLSDVGSYIADPEGYLATLPHCPWCEFEKVWGDAEMGRDLGMYNVSTAYCFNVISDVPTKTAAGTVMVPTLMVAEITQKGILNGLFKLEKDPEWEDFMAENWICDLEIIVTREEKNKQTTYSVGASPKSKPLPAESLADYRKKAFDLVALKSPPVDEDKIAEYLKKCPEPKEGDKPKARN